MTGMDRARAEALIAERLSPRRRDHAHRVAAEAVALAERFGAAADLAELAGLLHDLCRELPDAEILTAARRYGIPVGPVEARRPGRSCTAPSPPPSSRSSAAATKSAGRSRFTRWGTPA